MPVFVCDKCHTVDNTATGWWWCANRNQRMLGKDYPDGEAYCSECTPETFTDGSRNIKGGKWHGYFEKRKADYDYIKRLLETGNLALPVNKAVIEILGGEEECERIYQASKELKA